MNRFLSLPRRHSGFSLVEVALAIAIVAIVVLAVVGLLVPAQRTIDEILTSGQAGRLRQEIENEFSIRRPNEEAEFQTAFDKAYRAVKVSTSANGLYYAFFYRSKPDITNTAGRLEPYTEQVKDKRVGVDYLVQAAVMSGNEYKSTPGYSEALEGRLFLVRFTPIEGLVEDNTARSPFQTLPANGLAAFIQSNESTVYPLAVLPVTADFYLAQDLDNPATTLATALEKGTAKPFLSLNIGFNR